MSQPGRESRESRMPPLSSASDARHVIQHLTDVMEALLDVVEQETVHVRAGRLGEVAQLEPTKADLARLYLTDIARLKASRTFLRETMPEEIAGLRKRHDAFYARLQVNLTVLATAHAVSEGIVRGLSAELTRKTTPQTYGATGYANAGNPRAGVVPLTVSRSL